MGLEFGDLPPMLDKARHSLRAKRLRIAAPTPDRAGVGAAVTSGCDRPGRPLMVSAALNARMLQMALAWPRSSSSWEEQGPDLPICLPHRVRSGPTSADEVAAANR